MLENLSTLEKFTFVLVFLVLIWLANKYLLFEKFFALFENKNEKSSALMDYLKSYGTVDLIASGKLESYTYIIFGAEEKVVFNLMLSHNYPIHIAFVSQHDPDLRRFIHHRLKLYEAEGLFPQDFAILYEKGKHIDMLSVLGPETMAYLIDFCKYHYIEILDNNIYISYTSNSHGKYDETSIVKDSVHIASKIESKLTMWQKHKLQNNKI